VRQVGYKQITFKMKIIDHMFHNHIRSSDRYHERKQNDNTSQLKIGAPNTSVTEKKWYLHNMSSHLIRLTHTIKFDTQ